MGYGLAEWLITAPGGREMTLQMSYFDRVCEPVVMDIGPVLDLADLVGWKTVAVISRDPSVTSWTWLPPLTGTASTS
jgi:hypothetical protein